MPPDSTLLQAGQSVEILLNGRAHSTATGNNISQFLAELGFAGRPVLVEHNGIALLASEHALTPVAKGDRVELIQIVAGG